MLTGASLQFGWVDNLVSLPLLLYSRQRHGTDCAAKSADPKNQVFAIIRSRGTAGPLEDLAANRKNIHIVVTDSADPKKLDEAAAEISNVTGGSLDVLVLNAGSAGPESTLPPSAL